MTDRILNDEGGWWGGGEPVTLQNVVERMVLTDRFEDIADLNLHVDDKGCRLTAVVLDRHRQQIGRNLRSFQVDRADWNLDALAADLLRALERSEWYWEAQS